MSNETEKLSEADEIRALLPWYVTGKIEASERARIEAYVARHPEMQREIAEARAEADSIFTSNAEIEVPHYALDKLMKSVAASPSVRLHAAGTSLLDRFGELLAALAPRQLAYAAISAALALAVVAGAVGSMLGGASQYNVATGPGPDITKGTYALLTFKPEANAGALSAFLEENKIEIVEGPKPGGLYRVRLSSEALSADEAKARIEKLKARADVVAGALTAPVSK